LRYSIGAAGEEPTYYADLIPLLELINSMPHFEKENLMSTNGWGIARDPTLAKKLKNLGIDTVDMTLFGLKETHDWFAQRKGAFTDLLVAAEHCAEVGLRVEWKIMLHKRNIHEIDAMERLLKGRGRLRGYFLAEPDGRGQTNQADLIEWSDISALPVNVLENIQSNFTDLANIPNCSVCMKRKFPTVYIEHSGETYYRWQSLEHYSHLNCLGNIFQQDINEIIHRTKRMELFRILCQVSLRDLCGKYGRKGDEIHGKCNLHKRWISQYLADSGRL